MPTWIASSASAIRQKVRPQKFAQLAPFGIALIGSVASIWHDLFEHLSAFLKKYESYQADDLCISAILFFAAYICFLLQRSSQLRLEIEYSQKLERQSFNSDRHDALTGIPNRIAFMEAIHVAESQAKLMLIDLNGFKEINEWSGHLVGDKVLIEVAGRLDGLCASGLLTIAARLGGDEFGCLFTGEADQTAQLVISTIGRRMTRIPDEPCLTAAVGVTPLGFDNRTVDQLLSAADLAMSLAKPAEKSTIKRSPPPASTKPGKTPLLPKTTAG